MMWSIRFHEVTVTICKLVHWELLSQEKIQHECTVKNNEHRESVHHHSLNFNGTKILTPCNYSDK